MDKNIRSLIGSAPLVLVVTKCDLLPHADALPSYVSVADNVLSEALVSTSDATEREMYKQSRLIYKAGKRKGNSPRLSTSSSSGGGSDGDVKLAMRDMDRLLPDPQVGDGL